MHLSQSRFEKHVLLILVAIVISGGLTLSQSRTTALAQEPTGDAAAEEPIILPTPDRIAGNVFQTTNGGPPPIGVEVTLITLDAQNAQVDEESMRVAADGLFEFTELTKGDQYRYVLVSQYGPLQQTVRVEDALDTEAITLRIYESTSSLDRITATSFITVIPRVDKDTQVMDVLEMVELSNGGDRTFVADLSSSAPGGSPEMLRFGLPEGYSDLTVDSDLPSGNVLEIATGFALNNAIPPGDYRILFSYVVEFDGAEMIFNRSLPIAIHEYRALLPAEFGTISSEGFSPADDAQLGETNYRVILANGFAANERVTLTVSGLPTQGFIRELQDLITSNSLTTIGTPAIATVAMAFLLACVFVFKKRREPAVLASAPDSDPDVVAAIADLNEAHEAGEITTGDYETRRAGFVSQALGETEPPHAPESTTNEPSADETPAQGIDEEGADIVMAIADLDDAHDAGEIADDEYEARRKELMARALESEES